MENLIANFNYVIVVILMMIGLWAMLAQKNLIKKCIGMAIFQTGIILFFISIGAKNEANRKKQKLENPFKTKRVRIEFEGRPIKKNRDQPTNQ